MSLLADLKRNCGIINTISDIDVSERGKKNHHSNGKQFAPSCIKLYDENITKITIFSLSTSTSVRRRFFSFSSDRNSWKFSAM
jgi:hypothetical protein